MIRAFIEKISPYQAVSDEQPLFRLDSRRIHPAWRPDYTRRSARNLFLRTIIIAVGIWILILVSSQSATSSSSSSLSLSAQALSSTLPA
jgi:hypothetical protein